jgi:hypothetical protein
MAGCRGGLHRAWYRRGSHFSIFFAADTLFSIVKQRNSLLGDWQGIVPGIGLLPVPGRAMLLAALFSVSAHDPPGGSIAACHLSKMLTGNQGDGILRRVSPGTSPANRRRAGRVLPV